MRRHFVVLLLLGMVILFSGCGNSIKGEYVADTGGVLVNFKSGGIVEINGTPYPYEIKGKAITVKEGEGKEEIFIVMDDGSLQVNGLGMTVSFRKKK